MNRNQVIAIGLVVAAGAAGWFYYQGGQPTESERSLMESCLISEEMVRLSGMVETGLTITAPAGSTAMCEKHRQKLGHRKVKAITDAFREEQEYQRQYGTPQTVDLTTTSPAQASR